MTDLLKKLKLVQLNHVSQFKKDQLYAFHGETLNNIIIFEKKDFTNCLYFYILYSRNKDNKYCNSCFPENKHAYWIISNINKYYEVLNACESCENFKICCHRDKIIKTIKHQLGWDTKLNTSLDEKLKK